MAVEGALVCKSAAAGLPGFLLGTQLNLEKLFE